MSKTPAPVTPPSTLMEAIRFFEDRDLCLAFLAQLRWPDGNVACPNCGSREIRFLSTRRLWECKTKHPKRQFSIKVGTIFEDSAIPLDKWMTAVWLLANCKNGVSSYELARDLKITQKSAWFMLHRIRLAMQESGGMLGGPGSTVQVDETWIGGAARWMNAKRRKKAATGKAPSPYSTPRAMVLGMLEKGGRVKAKVMGRATRWDLWSEINAAVAKGSEIHTDELTAYRGLADQDYAHKVVNHSETYVDGLVHTNGIENFWGLLKRAIRGTYVSVEPFHLFRYLDEQAFRFNERKSDDRGRFLAVLATVIGRRLTYRALTGAELAARPA
ncbi:MAG TPA: IS1595 family transposase [Candidatus Binatia bacterium]|nr:IS1595 family transposase [Candidatus Binatia bacterium]